MVYGPDRARANAKKLSLGSRIWHFLCLKSVRTELGIPAKYASARLAANAVPKAHRHYTWPAPPGYPKFYGSPFIGAGHITLSDVPGKEWSNDVKRDGGIDLVDETSITKSWRLPKRFWATQLNGVNLELPAHPAPPVKPAPKPKPAPVQHAEAHYPGYPMKFGVKGAAVIAIQKHLKIKETGVYDAATIIAVKVFQKRHPILCRKGLARFADGVTGPKTYKAITGHN
jgi:hypothetical protein